MLLTPSIAFYIIITVLVISGFIFFFVNLVSRHKEQIREFTEQIDDADIACEKLKHQLAILENKNIILSSDLNKARQHHQKHLDRLKPEYRKIYTQLMTTIDKLDLMTSRFHDSEDAFNSLLDDNRELELELHELTAENIHLRDEIVSLKNRIPMLVPEQNTDSTIINADNQNLCLQNSSSDNQNIGNEDSSINDVVVSYDMSRHNENNTIQKTLSDLESQKNLLILEIEQLTNRLSSLESHKNTDVHIETQNKEIAQLKSTVDALLHINSELTAKGLYLESELHNDIKIPQTSSTIHDSLNSVLSKITLNANVKASTIADNLGLIVVEKGQRKYTEGLAGIAASFDSLNKQIHSFIPLGELKQITVTDKNDVTVSAFPFTVSDEKLVVMLLSAGTGPTTTAVQNALTGASDLNNHATTINDQNNSHFVIAQ